MIKISLFGLAAACALFAGPAAAQAAVQAAAPDYPTLAFRALVIADAGYNAMGVNPATVKFKSGFNIRRIQLSLDGDLDSAWAYSLGIVFTGKAGFLDHRYTGYLQYNGFDAFSVRAGIFAAPAGYADSAGAANSLFLERPSGATISRGVAGSPARATLSFIRQRATYLAAISYTGGKIGMGGTLNEQQGVVGRLAWLAVDQGDWRWSLDSHVSYAFDLRSPGNGPGLARLSDGPEQSLDSNKTVDTRNLDARAITEWGLETAATWSRAYVQAGFFHFDVARRTAVPDADFIGWYTQASWSLTGETRRYRPATGTFGSPVPATPLGEGGFGAVELAASYSNMDLNSNPLAGAGLGAVAGGAQNIRALGVNWFPTAAYRVSLIYQNIRTHQPLIPANDISADALVLRLQATY